MKVLVAPCSGFKQEHIAAAIQESRFNPKEIVIGGIKATETWIKTYAKINGIPCMSMLSMSAAGANRMIRNLEQIHAVNAVIAFWEGSHNPIQEHLINSAKEKGIPVFIYSHNEEDEDEELN